MTLARKGVKLLVFFHNPDEENGVFSNWYLSDFTVDGIKYSSMEQYMMYEKAVIFNDGDAARKILSTSNVAAIKALGRAVKDYNDHVWSGVRQLVVYRGLVEKFRQNDDLRRALLSTGNQVLAECAVKDRIWGIGLSMRDERRFDMSKWQGLNLLGYSLMVARAALAR